MRIVTDCAADLAPAELEALAITQAPLFIHFPEGGVSAADIAPDAFYDRLEAMRPAVPTTAQPAPGDFAAIYQNLAAADPQILSLHISSGLSGTVNSARLGQAQAAAAQVTVWDTLTLSGGQRFQVLAAAWAARAGWAWARLEARLREIQAHGEVVYTLDTLEYLARGGRIGRVQALAGALLNLKPVITVDHTDGKYSTLGRARTIARAIASMVDHLQAVYAQTPLWVTVLHGRFAEKAEALAREAGQRLNVARLETARISPVLGVHTGPGIVGLAALPMRLLEDLVGAPAAATPSG
ncbi:MAG: DegV family protein [Anaerolineales bacterium]|nr:DegV family protein [Anaerolineales bacterium]